MTSSVSLRLRVTKIEQACSFQLTWGDHQELFAQLPYPSLLTEKYNAWKQTYQKYYGNLQRGRVLQEVSVELPTEYLHADLSKKEADLLSEFHQWLRRAELFEIRNQIAAAAKQATHQANARVDLFLTCTSAELIRLPWEAWEMAAGAIDPGVVRIARTPPNMRHETVKSRKGKARILAIVGYDEKQDFETDLREVQQSLKGMAEVEYVVCKDDRPHEQLREEIRDAIANPRGWDILFFSGHSNEMALTGGQLEIAPGVTLLLKDIQPQLIQAKERGLQFALFNSCNGLDIAQSLVNLGISQVAIMREPIHNNIAQEFLVRFLQGLANLQDVHASLLSACQHLKLEKQLTYPSAYLVPSLFRAPNSVPFYLEKDGFGQRLKRWAPRLVLTATVVCSLLYPVQDFLLGGRTFAQAVYRDVTQQFPQKGSFPPVILIAVDQKSLNQAKKKIPNFQDKPLDRQYLASIVTKLSTLGARVIGIDYFLDLPQGGEKEQHLAKSINTAIQQQGTWFVFGMISRKNMKLVPEVVNLNNRLQGDVAVYGWDLRTPEEETCSQLCPFAYLLSLVHALRNGQSQVTQLQPSLRSEENLQDQLSQAVQEETSGTSVEQLLQYANPPLGLKHTVPPIVGLRSILDFSIPPGHIYKIVPSRTLWQADTDQQYVNLDQQIVILGAGAYERADDIFPLPPAIDYWCRFSGRGQRCSHSPEDLPERLMGAELHAYMLQHFLSRKRIVLVPDLWVVGVAIILSQVVVRYFATLQTTQCQTLKKQFAGALALYGLVSMQLYVSASIALPWLLPSVAFWLCSLSVLERRNYA